MRSRVLLLAALALCAAPPEGHAQIVNTIAGFDERATGWTGSARAAASMSGGNTEVLSLKGSLRAQWQGGRERVRVLGGASRKEAGNETIAESMLAHLRHNHALTPRLRTLAFAQAQRNPFQRLETRLLAGAGLRVEPLAPTREPGPDEKRGVLLAAGAAYMIESEEIEGAGSFSTSHRLSTFLLVDGTLPRGVEVSASAFYQPLWSDFSDARAVADAGVVSNLIGGLSLFLIGSWQYDSEPPEGVEKADWDLESGLEFAF